MQLVHCQNDLRYAKNGFISHKNCTKQSEGDINISRSLVIISMFIFYLFYFLTLIKHLLLY